MIRDLVAIFGVIAGFSYYVLTVRNAQRNQQVQLETRQLQAFLQIMSMAFSKEGFEYMNILDKANVSNYEEFLEKSSNDVEYYNAFIRLARIYEAIGVFLKEGLLNIRLIALYETTGTIAYWEKYREIIYEQRRRINNNRWWDMWEYTYDTLKVYLEEHPELAP